MTGAPSLPGVPALAGATLFGLGLGVAVLAFVGEVGPAWLGTAALAAAALGAVALVAACFAPSPGREPAPPPPAAGDAPADPDAVPGYERLEAPLRALPRRSGDPNFAAKVMAEIDRLERAPWWRRALRWLGRALGGGRP
ncbi:MAG TPA: hypothetical protein VFS43_40715 [Polyangiaceae bacterium]|nr:hypothetical protein [Polyangiaceae bacterium]